MQIRLASGLCLSGHKSSRRGSSQPPPLTGTKLSPKQSQSAISSEVKSATLLGAFNEAGRNAVSFEVLEPLRASGWDHRGWRFSRKLRTPSWPEGEQRMLAMALHAARPPKPPPPPPGGRGILTSTSLPQPKKKRNSPPGHPKDGCPPIRSLF